MQVDYLNGQRGPMPISPLAKTLRNGESLPFLETLMSAMNDSLEDQKVSDDSIDIGMQDSAHILASNQTSESADHHLALSQL